MKKNEKVIIAALAVIAIVLIIFMVVKRGSNKVLNNTDTNVISSAEEFITTLGDGTKFNTSEKLHETKKFEGLEISELQLTSKNNASVILATVTNTSNTKQGGFVMVLTFVDRQGKTIKKVTSTIRELAPGEKTSINSSTTFDYSNAYDFTISREQ